MSFPSRQRLQQHRSLLPHVLRRFPEVNLVVGILIGLSIGSSSFYDEDLSMSIGLFSSLSGDESSTMMTHRRTTEETIKLSPSGEVEKNNTGWRTIDVFSGSSGSTSNSTSHQVSSATPPHQWYSQARQDEAVYTLLQKKQGGFFVDLAANDAQLLSNTYALEQFHGWDGLCIEPNPMYWYNLTTFRPRCQLVAAVVGKERDETVSFFYEGGDHGGIAGDGFDNSNKFKRRAMKANTVTLLEIFERYNVPSTIDYMSLDVEGAEEFIMGTFPLEKYKIRLLTIERPKVPLRELLEAHGYEQLQRIARWGETLWVHSSEKSTMDLSNLDSFSAKKQRELALKQTQEEDAALVQ